MSKTTPDLEKNGFVVVPTFYSKEQLAMIRASAREGLFRVEGAMRSEQVYAVRRALQVMPQLVTSVFSQAFRDLVCSILSKGAFITKSIWFEKPAGGNWFVGWHQDISISVKRRVDAPGYSRWTAKHGVIGVVPPLPILERTLTIRIHLDDADGDNGAVRVIAASHRSGIQPPPVFGTEGQVCCVPAGGVMLMRPLLLHASSRSVTSRPRRVLHVELNDMELTGGVEWAERLTLDL